MNNNEQQQEVDLEAQNEQAKRRKMLLECEESLNMNKKKIEEAIRIAEETELIALETARTLQVATMLHRSSGRNLFQKLFPCIKRK